MDYLEVLQPPGSGAGKWNALEGVRDRAICRAGLSPVFTSLPPRFVAPATKD